MVKLVKIALRLVGGIVEWLLILLIVFAFAIRTSPVQTYLARKATEFLSKELNTLVKLDAVDIVFIDRVDLKGLLVIDQQNDTLANINSLLVNVDGITSFAGKIQIEGITLDGGVIKINREAKTGDYNYWFLEDYFAGGGSTKKSKPVLVKLDNVKLKDVRFHYDDYRKGYSEYGMDFDHLLAKNINMDIQNIQIKNGIISAQIKKLQVEEKCGFQLQKLQTDVFLSENGLSLRKLQIVTPNSKVFSNDFRFIYSGYADYLDFEDSVTFDVKLQESEVSLIDVAYFGTALTGMDQKVTLSGNIMKKVKDLKINDLDLRTGRRTQLKGNFNLPDFRNLRSSFYQERVHYAYISIQDLKEMKMPDDYGSKHLSFDPIVERLGFFETQDARLDGIYSQFVLSADVVNCSAGSVNMNNGMLFQKSPVNDSYLFKQSAASEYDVKVNQFRLDKLLDDEMFGEVDGTFFLSGEAFSFSDIDFTTIQGNVNRFDLADYSYSNITITEGSFVDNVVLTKANVNDNNLSLTYDGMIDLTGEPKMLMTVDLQKALLNKLNVTTTENTSFEAKMVLDVVGLDPNKMRGNVTMNSILYKEGDTEIRIPSLSMDVFRSEENDVFDMKSSLANARLEGKIDFENIGPNFQEQFSKIFPGLYNYKRNKKSYFESKDFFKYTVTTGDLVAFFEVFAPDLYVVKGTTISGEYTGATSNFDMNLFSQQIQYQDKIFKGVRINQSILDDYILADYRVDDFAWNDSINIQNVWFNATGDGEDLYSKLSWNPLTENESAINWHTNFESTANINFLLEPSYFSLNEKRWDVPTESSITLDSTDLEITDFKLTRNDQYILINGHVSKNDKEKLKFELNEVDLYEISVLAGLPTELSGKLNGWGYISNPYTNLSYMGDLNVIGFKVDKEEIGDVFLLSHWDKTFNTVKLEGELLFRGIQSLDFDGQYFVSKEKDNLDFNLVFDETNIAFTNAFMDPDVLNSIRGFVDGKLKVRGTPNRPIIEGEIELKNASAKIELLGASFAMNGIVKADADGFYIDNMPISDAEGSTGSLVGSIYHDDYRNWNFDVNINLEDDAINRDPLQPWKSLPLRKFLVMDTDYKPGDIYFGKAYITGVVNVFGFTDNLAIEVNAVTQKGTLINFPMYGTSDIDGEVDFVKFVSRDSLTQVIKDKIDFTGVDLNLNFDVNTNAQLKILFDDRTGEEISATGYGNLGLILNQLGDVSLDGTYVLTEGKYNFVLGPIKQLFYVDPGGSITWTGNPYDANLNLNTFTKIRTSLSELSADQAGSGIQEVQCYLSLTESLMKPTIGFDIKAPKANSDGQVLLNRVTSDKDELNRQFFSLLLTKNFQPLRGSSKANGGGALDLVSSQINSLLGQVSKGYKLNVDLSNDQIAGSELALGVSKGFYNDRLIVTGSFGVENAGSAEAQSQSSLIGDLEVQLKLNESGTFRVNVFNESNDNSLLQTQNQGRFTQGAGIHYREDFNSSRDFRVLQTVLDLFRKKENKRYPVKRKKEQTPLPKRQDGIIPDENL